ncbi:MAG: hypothetical protein R3F53_17805 [Gammaproteobacteria bacterium]
MINQALHDMLQSVQVEKKTGRIVVLGLEGGHSRMCSLGMKDGEIVNASYQKLQDNAAITAILSLEVQQVRFLVVPDVPVSGFPGLYSINDILQDTADASRESSVKQGLQAEVTRLVTELINPSAAQMIETIAKNTSPGEQPKEFLDRSFEYAKMMAGKGKATSAFAPLFDKIK